MMSVVGKQETELFQKQAMEMTGYGKHGKP